MARTLHFSISPRVRSKLSGFSLPELLVAVAVMLILAGLVFPFAHQAIEMSHRAGDVSNLRQIGGALSGFAGDHGNCFPLAGGRIGRGETSTVTGSGPWSEQVMPYLGGNTNVFRSRRAPSSDPAGTFSPGYFLGTRPAMAANARFSAVNLLRMEAPAMTLLAGTVGAAGLFQPGDWDKDDYTQSPAFDENGRSRLPGGVAVLFADGHVRECARFDPATMTTEYSPGRWYSF